MMPGGPGMMGPGGLMMGGGPKKKKGALPDRQWGKVTKGVDMKKVQWKKVQDKKVKSSDFWKKIVESGFDDPEMFESLPEDFEEKFSRPKARKKGKKKKGGDGGDGKEKKAKEAIPAPTFMDGKRAQ